LSEKRVIGREIVRERGKERRETIRVRWERGKEREKE
jgi:hypothetical protein